MSRASCLLALGSSHLKFDVWPTWALDVDKAQALNSRLLHLILKLASCNTCNHPYLKSLHAARALKENWFSFQKNESRTNIIAITIASRWLTCRPTVSKTKDRAIINYHHDQNYDIYLETKLHNALISGHPGGGGGDPGEPPVICTTTFTNPPYPKPRLFNKKLLTPLPWGQRSVLCQVYRCNISKELYRRNRIFLPKNIVAM